MNNATRLKILHVILAITPTNSQYNEHCLPEMHHRDISICTYFKSKIVPPPQITLFDGDSTVMGFFRALQAALKAQDYDIVHVHTPHAGLLLLLFLIFTGQYFKWINHSVHTVHNSYQNFKLRNKLLFIPSFALFRCLVFCSNSSYESFPPFYRWLAKGRMHVVQNGVDLDRIDRIVSTVDATRSDIFTIMTVGMIPLKNPFTVLEAFRQTDHLDSRLVHLGDGILRPLLAEKIEEQGLKEHALLTGLIPRNSVFEWFSKADLFISASHGEGLPVAVMEAMACRCPVILSDIPPHREIAGETAFIPLIAPDDAAGFARAIHQFKEKPLDDRLRIGQDCRNLIEERFSLPAMSRGYIEVYSEFLRRPLASFQEVTG